MVSYEEKLTTALVFRKLEAWVAGTCNAGTLNTGWEAPEERARQGSKQSEKVIKDVK